jgi:hypothetical protein
LSDKAAWDIFIGGKISQKPPETPSGIVEREVASRPNSLMSWFPPFKVVILFLERKGTYDQFTSGVTRI